SKNGYGKRTTIPEFPVYGRGGQGVIAMQTSERNGTLVGAVQVIEGEQIMLISDRGTMVRTRVDEIPTLSRNTQGVRLIRLKNDEALVGIQTVAEAEEVALYDDTVEAIVSVPESDADVLQIDDTEARDD
ncbi:MAG: DNA gyrase C-terminal beta-propeller domain-containing protein, partial [Pseudohongiella sp.]|nr:DNA gyrase C-terminal beta-propeller domain-containing protein [Pseudohongiella sp.]